MSKYEVLYVLRTDIEEQAIHDAVEKFNALIAENGGTVSKCDEWGKRRLAYPIDYKNEGYYVLLEIDAPADLPAELERNFKINDSVIRYLVTRMPE